jgi:ACS family glucarate transporter-like MFS transporter
VKQRNRVLAMICALMWVLMLDRVCLSVAGPRMQAALHIGPVAWGWVNAVFAMAFACFEIPMGALGDRIGPRKVLTRIVLWWSGFTALTGAMVRLPVLMVVRFLFGLGEAGGYPNASIVIARWFPQRERGRAFGFMLSAAQLGGAVAPLVIVPIMARFGWRAGFWSVGALGPLWAVGWFFWFRDSPREMAGVSPEELAETADAASGAHHNLPWTIALRSGNVWAAPAICFCYIYTYIFFASWFHTYLVKARGFSEKDLWLSSLPFAVAVVCNLAGGYVSNVVLRRFGLKACRSGIGFVGLTIAGFAIIGVMLTHSGMMALLLLSLASGGITFQQPMMFAICLDIGGEFSGAMVGIMNTASGVTSFVAALAFGYIVSLTGSYVLPFLPMAGFLFLGALLWIYIDPRKQIPSAIDFRDEVADAVIAG